MIKNHKNSKLDQFDKLNEELQEAFFCEMGINVIWVDDHAEIPEIIEEIRTK